MAATCIQAVTRELLLEIHREFPELVELNFANHQISDITNVQWQLLPSLTRIDLSFNCLERLGGLDAAPLLREVVVNHNHIAELLAPRRSLAALVWLDARNNHLPDLAAVIRFTRACPRLQYLYLSGNPCCEGYAYASTRCYGPGILSSF